MSISAPISQIEGTTKSSIASAVPAGQVGALCWRLHKGQPQVLLVTSRESGRWVLPKGWPMPDRGPDAAAAREAWEEAGVEGKVSPVAIGTYTYTKALPNEGSLSCAVEVFPLRVESLKRSFPERRERRRKWFSAPEAARMVAETDLRELLSRLGTEPDWLAPAARTKRTKAAT